MGEATAKLFASEGAKVAAVDLNAEGLSRVVGEIEEAEAHESGGKLCFSPDQSDFFTIAEIT